MNETLKNRPIYGRKGDCPNCQAFDDWLKGFETKMRSFRESSVQCIEWLQKYTMIDPLDDMKLMQVQAVLRTFIEKEILGK